MGDKGKTARRALCALALAACARASGSSGSDGRACSLPAGTYTMHFVPEDAGGHCPAIPEQTIDVKNNETFQGSTHVLAGVGSGCTASTDTSSCTVSENCTRLARGVRTSIALTLTYTGTSIEGKETIASTDDRNTPRSTCTYAISTSRA